jgi:hypothetical protein
MTQTSPQQPPVAADRATVVERQKEAFGVLLPRLLPSQQVPVHLSAMHRAHRDMRCFRSGSVIHSSSSPGCNVCGLTR